ncbi:helix-turn-helix domain-containing protein [Streptomyces sp. NPDC053705]|jgi:transcriptional regulator with XRE-family HTH domain|uniref:helix-turn-helix domain-containing protein n=1 Tax=Streptomyces TaxID=1883 RepID=UPI00341BB1A0
MHETRKAALKKLLEERRGLIDPSTYDIAPHPRGKKGRRAPGLSQQQVADLCHVSRNTYVNLESGITVPDVSLLRRVATLLGLNEQEWIAVCRYAGIGDPPGPLTPASGKELPAGWQKVVDDQGYPAYVTDASWDVIAYNKPFERFFPEGRVPWNTMRWMTLEPDGRRMLIDWRTAWAPLVLPQLSAALAARPDDETLQRLERDVLADPDCAPIYEAGGAYIHPDGDERPIRHAIDGKGWVALHASQPLTAPGARHITMIFYPGEQRTHTRTPPLRSQ